MAVAVVTAQNIRVFDAQSLTGITSIGGGSGAALESDFSFNDTRCIARKGTTGERGMQYASGSPQNLSGGIYSTMMLKLICTTPGLLDARATQAFSWRTGSAAGAYHRYDLQGSDTYPITRSWLLPAIDPNVAAHRSGTVGSPALSAVDYYGLVYDQSGTSKSPNQGLAAIDVGAGLTVTGGDGASADASWQDLITFDWGTQSNRFGYIQEAEGIVLVTGKIVIGGSAATEFSDPGRTILFVDGLFASGFSGINADLTNAASVVDLSGQTFIGRGTKAGEDTRPVVETTGSSGSAVAVGARFENHNTLEFNDRWDLTGASAVNSDTITQGGANLSGFIVSGSTSTSAAIVVNDLSRCDGLSVSNSGANGVDLTALASTSITMTNIRISDSAGFDVVVDNAEDVVINVGDGSIISTATNIGAGNVSIQAGITSVLFALDFAGSIPADYEWRLYERSSVEGFIGTVELDGNENETSATFQFDYPFVSVANATLQIIADGFIENIFEFELIDSNQQFFIRMSKDTNI